MRKTYLLIILLLYTEIVFASAGIFKSTILISKNGGSNVYYLCGGTDAGLANFNGLDLGNLKVTETLVLNGAGINTFQNSGDNVDATDFFYRIYKSTETPGGFIQSNVFYNSGDGNPNKYWESSAANIDLIAATNNEAGTYFLEVYFRGDASYSGGTFQIFDNNGTNNYKAQFTILANQSSGTGNWSSQTWSYGSAPTSSQPVEIQAGHTVTIDGSVNCKFLTINGILDFNGTNTLSIANGGKFINNGTFNAGSSSVDFSGGGTVSGTVDFNNVSLQSGGVDFGSNSTVNGTLTINAGGYVNNNSPTYGTGSTLKYNVAAVYGRGNEWNSTSGAGYPYNVQISNNTELNLGANSGTSVQREVANNLVIDAGSALYMDYLSDDMTQPLLVHGNVTVNGTISLSNSSGGDLKLEGDLLFGETSTFNANERAIFFIKDGTQTIAATNTAAYDVAYIVLGYSGGSGTTLQLDQVDIVADAPQTGNAISFTNSTDKIDLNGNKLTIGKTGVTCNLSGDGEIVGSIASDLEILGTGTLGGTIKFSSGSEQLNNLIINRTNSGVVNLGSDLTINNALTLTSGKLNTSSNTITLGSAASLNSESTGNYVVGNLTTTRAVGTSANTFGGIGVSIDAGSDDLGNMIVTRVSGSSGQVTVNSNSGVNRKWTITADNPPSNGRTVTLSWLSDDDNSKDMQNAEVWKSDDAGTTWFKIGTTQDVSASDPRSISASVTSFSIFTVTDNASPLPVELTSFTALSQNEVVNLKWETATEVNNYGFEIERTIPNSKFQIGRMLVL
ncbi:MAG: hypothetical protein K8F60_04170 [Melioribacteraceae bacterium]|nr:hypothetical protein [Melioribacteraceae bacterium]